MLSARLRSIVDRLPLYPGVRILEIGCGSGMMAREMAERVGNGYVLGIDRSAIAIAKAQSIHPRPGSAELSFRHASIEEFELLGAEAQFDLAVAVRVGALDGRHPELELIALQHIARALRPGGLLFVDDLPPREGRDIEAGLKRT